MPFFIHYDYGVGTDGSHSSGLEQYDSREEAEARYRVICENAWANPSLIEGTLLAEREGLE